MIGVWLRFLEGAAAALEVPHGLCLAINPKDHARGVKADSVTRKAFLARAVAAYCANVLNNIPQADIARAVGVSRKSICVTVQRVEDARDDAEFEKMIQRLAALTGVEAAP